MTDNSAFTAELLKRSAAGYAGAAASLLLERQPDLRAQGGALAAWHAHLSQRVLELAAAVAAAEPVLFRERVLWSRATFAARGRDTGALEASLTSLRDVLAADLPARAIDVALLPFDQAITALKASEAPRTEVGQLDPDTAAGRPALRYLQQVLEGNAAEATAELVTLVQTDANSAEEVYLNVLLPAQHEIGRLWHAAQVTVAEEHLVTAATQRVMAILSYMAPRSPANGATVVAACVVGNAHDIGLRALADLFYLRGWRSIFLGADVPVADLPAVLAGYGTDLLLLSGTLSTQIDAARIAIAKVRDQCSHPVGIIAGGAAFDEVPELACKLGADAYAATLSDALKLGSDWLKRRKS